MSNIFHQYVENAKEPLEKLEELLIEDQKKPLAQREINSPNYSENRWSFNKRKMTPLQFALMQTVFDDTPRLKKIIDLYLQYSDFTVEGDYGTALDYACIYTNNGKDVIKTITSQCPELISKETNTKNDSSYPIHSLACYDITGECLQELIDAGADVNTRATKSGWTPLHQAAYVNNEKAVLTLLKNGADKYATDNRGSTPMSDSCYWTEKASQHAEIVKLMNDFKPDETAVSETNLSIIVRNL